MEILEALYTRRSIRKFREGEISDDQIRKILRAGMSSPTSGNQQPWQFIVVKKRNMIEELIKAYPYAKMLRDVPAAIMVCKDKNKEKWEMRWQMDLANATYGMLLAAHGLGFGGVWLEIYPIEERMKMIQESFNLPEDIIPFAVIGIGHPDEEKPAPNRYDESSIHYDTW